MNGIRGRHVLIVAARGTPVSRRGKVIVAVAGG
jgi:hypothetical protein